MDDIRSLYMLNRFTLGPFVIVGCLLIILRFPLSSDLYILLPFYLGSILFNILTKRKIEHTGYMAILLQYFDKAAVLSASEFMIIILKIFVLSAFSGNMLYDLNCVRLDRIYSKIITR